MPGRWWKPEEVKTLRALAPLGSRVVAQELSGRSLEAIERKALDLGIPIGRQSLEVGRRQWRPHTVIHMQDAA